MEAAMSEEIRKALVQDPIHHMPAWTVALLDPTMGELPRRRMDELATRHYAEAIAHLGAPGVLFAASTGWGHVRSFHEHWHTLQVGGQAQLGKSIRQALLRNEDTLEENGRLIHALKEWGYAMVWTRRGASLPVDAGDEQVADHLLALAKLAVSEEMPLGLYSISSVDGAPLTATAARLLLERLGRKHSSWVVAIKITEADFESTTLTFLKDPAFSHKKIVQGWDAHYSRALQAGHRADGSFHCGATSGAAACMVKAFRGMYQKALMKDWTGLVRIQKAVTAAFLSMQGDDKSKFPDLQIAKMVMGLGQPLTEERTMEQGEKLVTKIEELFQDPETNEGTRLIAESLLLMGKSELWTSPFYERLIKLI
jgi:dihydrodipicolinate synthase/N-acetylneuraminate lyase